MDPTITVSAITGVSGIAVGFLGGWFSRPAAQAKVEREALKREHQRKILADARQMVAEATKDNRPKSALANDPRLLAVRSQLDEGVLAPYKHNPMAQFTSRVSPGTPDHTPLLANLDRLERQWGLV